MNFSQVKSAHFIGIGGIGTSAIARMFLLEGKQVSGSDIAESEVTKSLQEAGVVVYVEDAGKGVPADCDLVIYTIAIPKDHPGLVEAKKRGIPILSYPEALGIISRDKYTIAITGTHGKTTTTAMVAKILMDAGFDPTVIVGSFLLQGPSFKTNFIAGKSKYLVVEGCEYRRSFLNLHPKVLVITNIDADHLDYYKNIEDIASAFYELSAKVPNDGAVVCDVEDKRVLSVTGLAKAPVLSYPPCDIGTFKLRVPGKHNILNAKAAATVASFLGISREKILQSLGEFLGTWRRFEYRGKAANGAVVYDDYGHHPREIEAALQGARELFPTQKIIVVFQPHLYSRTKDHLAGFGKCFKQANEVILLPIYPAREKDPGDINSEMVAAEIKKNDQSANFVKTFAEAAALAQELSSAGDLILTLGAGETNCVADIIVRR